MTTQPTPTDPIEALYRQMLAAWNKRSAIEYATCFAVESNVIGFDGSQMNGQAAIEAELQRIFTDHQTGKYVAKVREIRYLSPEVALLRAVSGLVPPGQSALNPTTNAIQTLVAQKIGTQWRATLFQNTPAQFHGRPELAEALTKELSQLV